MFAGVYPGRLESRGLPALGLLAAVLILGFVPARAHGVDYAGIDQLYFHRDQDRNLEKSISAIDELAKPDDGELYWRRCRSLIRRGELREKRSEKLADYDLAQKDCAKAVELSSGSADAHFWYGVAMGRWGETKGILKAMFLIKPIRREMAATLAIDPKHGGAHRVLGEMLWQIPGFAGGDKKAALAEYETAVSLAPDHSTNYPILAEAYLHFGRRDDAIRVLKAVAEIKYPDDPAEYPGDLADAQKLLAKLTK